MADRITSIYEKACAKGILDPQTQSEQWFRDQLSTEQGVKSFYDHATANGMKFHPYPEFKERLTQPIAQPSQPAQPAQPLNPSVAANPAPTTEEEYQQGMEKQDLASGAATPFDANQWKEEQMRRNAEEMRRNAEQMAKQAGQQPSMPKPSLSLDPKDGSMGAALQRMQQERLPEIRKQTIANNMLNETAQSLGELQRADREKWMAQGEGMTPTQRSYLAQAYTEDPYLAAANSVLYNAEVRMQDAKRQSGISWKNIGEGLASFGKDTGRHLLTKLEGMASFGMSDLRNAKYQRDVLKKVADANAFDNPDAVLTPQEKALYDATVTNIAVEIARQNDTSRWSKAGQITADMIPFIEDIMIGNALFKGFGNAGREAITKGVEKHVKNKLAKWLLTNVGDVAMSAGESAATAAILPHTFANMYGNMTQADMDKVGMDGYRMTLGGVKEQGAAQAWGNAYRDQVKELFTETGGNFRLIGRALVDNPLGRKILKTPFGMVLRRFEGAKGGAGSRLASMTMYHGVLGEWLEELEGAIYDGNLKDFFTADTQLPMLLSFSVPAAFTGGLNASQQMYYNSKYKSAGKQIDQLIDASSYVGPDKNTLKGQILATLYQTPTEDIPAAIGACVEQVYPEEYKALMEGAPEQGNKAAELAYAFKEYLTSGTVLTVFDPDMLGGQIADVAAHRENMRQQAAQAAQAEIESIAHPDGNIYRVGIKGRDDVQGYAYRGQLGVTPNDDGTYSTSGRELVTIKLLDNTVLQVPADEVTLLDAPASAEERLQAVTDHLFAQYANNDVFHIGDKVYLQKDGQRIIPESSTITGIDDDGVHVESMDEQGNPQDMIIPHEQAAEMLAVADGETEDGIVTFNVPEGEPLRLRQVGEGVYETIEPVDGQMFTFTDEDLANMGAVRAEEAPIGESNQNPQGKDTQTPMGNGNEPPVVEQPSYPQDENGNPDWGQIEQGQAAQLLYDRYKGNTGKAQAVADDMLAEAKKVQKQASKQTSHSLNLDERDAENAQFDQMRAAADAAVKYWEQVKLSLNQIKTAEEQAAAEAQRQAMQQAREERSKTETGTVTSANMAERYEAAPKIIGNAGTTTLPDGRELAGHYVLIAPEGVTASHNATANFQRSEGYPVTADGQSINDRDYTNDKEEQQKVATIAQNFNGNAIKNMPVISDEGMVYNGNGRMMAGQLAALNNTDEAYMQSLAANAAQFGFTPEQVASIPHARVAFQLDERLPYSTQSLAIFNEQETQTQSNTGKAAGYARKLTPQAVSEVLAAVDGFNTIDAFFSDKKAPFNLINSLINAGIIAQREKAEMVDGEKLSATGRERLSNILFGTVFDNETIRLMGDDAALKNSILRALPQILDNKSLGEFSLESDINDAIRLLYEVRKAKMPFRSFVSQTVIAEDGQTHTAAEDYSPYQLLLAEEMTEGGVDAFRDVLTLYNDEARMAIGGQADIFGNLMNDTELKNLILQRYGKEPTETERPNAGRQAEPSVQSTPASNEPAAEVTEPAKSYPQLIFAKNYYKDNGAREIAHGIKDNDLDSIFEAADEMYEALKPYVNDMVNGGGITFIPIPSRTGKADSTFKLATLVWQRITDKTPKWRDGTVSFSDALEGNERESLYELKKAGKSIPDGFFGYRLKGELPQSGTIILVDGVYATGATMDAARKVVGPDAISLVYAYDDTKAESTPEERLAQAEAETDTNPTEAQKKAENYKQGHVTLWGLPITIENPKGSIRRGTDANGKQWEQEMHHTYGKIRRTEGVDGDHIDVFIGPNLSSERVFVVDQLNQDTGEFDEHKVMLGFDSIDEAQAAYLSNYEEGWRGMGPVTEVTMDEFKKWIDSSHRKTKPFAEYKSVKKEAGQSAEAGTTADNEQLRDELAEELRKYDEGDTSPVDENVAYDTDDMRAAVKDMLNRYQSAELSDALAKVDAAGEKLSQAQGENEYLAAAYALEDEEEAFVKTVRDIVGDKAKAQSRDLTLLEAAKARQRLAQRGKAVSKMTKAEILEELERYADGNLFEMTPKMAKRILALAKKYGKDLPEPLANMASNAALLTKPKKATKKAEAQQPAEQPKAEQPKAEPVNTVFTQDAYEAAKARMKARLNRLNMGLDPEMLADQIVIAGYHVERGARRFADFARALIYDFGDGIRQYAKQMYNYLRDIPEGEPYRAEMDDYATVMAFDIDNFDKNAPKSEKSSEKIWSSQEFLVTLQPNKEDKPEDQAEQQRQIDFLIQKGIDNIVAEYIANNGNKLDPDELRKVFTEIGYDGSNVPQYKHVEGLLREYVFHKMLEKAIEEGKTSVVFLSGCAGCGKSRTLKNEANSSIKALTDAAGIVYDAPLTSYNKLSNVISAIYEHGLTDSDVTVIQVYNNVERNFQNVLERGVETGRVLSLKYFEGSFTGGNGKLQSLQDEMPDVNVICLDNSNNNGGQVIGIEEAKTKFDYTISDEQYNVLLDKLEDYVERAERNPDEEGLAPNLLAAIAEGLPEAASSRPQLVQDRVADLVARIQSLGVGGNGERGSNGSKREQSSASEPVRLEEEKPAAKFAKGEEVIYKKQYEAVIEDVNADGTYNLSYPNALGINTVMFNIPESDIDKKNPPSGPDGGNTSPQGPTKGEDKQSPMQRQFQSIKEQYPDAVLLFRVGDFYELYDTDAEEGSKILGITLTRTTWAKMAGFPFHALDTYLPKLVRAGKRVAICDQLEDPKIASKLVKRDVIEQHEQQVMEKAQAEVAKTEPQQVVTDTIGEITESKHTKTGEPIWVVKPMERVSNDEFKVLKRRAKLNNGYYSTFVKGFVFNSVNDATRFNNISDEQTTTEQTSADTEAVISTAESTAAEASVVERTEPDAGSEDEQGVEIITQDAEPTDEEIVKYQEAIDKVDAAIEQVNKQLAILGYYESDEDPTKFHESYGYMKTAEAKALKDIDKLAKQLAADLGIEVSKRKKIANANIAPAGGDITFRLPLNEGRELYVNISLRPNNGYWRMYPDGGQKYDLAAPSLYWRVENPNASGYSRYGENHNYGESLYGSGHKVVDITYDELLRDIKFYARQYLPEAPKAEVPADATPLEAAKARQEATKKKKAEKNRIPDGQQVLDLFADVADEINDGLHEEDVNPPLEEQTQPITSDNGNTEVRNDGRRKGRTKKTESTGQPADQNGTLGGSQRQADERPEAGGVGSRSEQHRVHDGERGLGTAGQRTTEPVERKQSLRLRYLDEFGVEHILDANYYTLGDVYHINDRLNGDQYNVKASDVLKNIKKKIWTEIVDTPTQETEAPIAESERKNTHNFRYDPNDPAPTSNVARYEANMAAIRLLKQLQDEGRQATPEEQRVLAKFTGWGGLGEYFKGEPGTTYWSDHGEKSPYQILKELLTDEELEAAQLSRNSAYYTPAAVIDELWNIAEQLGFKGGNVLEGSAGIGNILAQMPQSISDRSNIQAVEIDNITAGILAQLYPDATTYAEGFEDVILPNNSQDLVITNVPFVTGLRVHDKKEKDLSKRFHNIHDFCIAKNVRKLRQGGLGIFITSSGTLDSSKDLRRWLNNEGDADVIGAFRLNRETFGGTSATSDIIVVRKRVNGVKDPHAIDVLDTMVAREVLQEFNDEYFDYKTRTWKKDAPQLHNLTYNKYFVEHPESMGGEMGFGFEHGDTRWGGTTAGCYPSASINQAQRLSDWIKSLSAEPIVEAQPEEMPTGNYEKYDGTLPYGAIELNSKGEICKVSHGELIPIQGINELKVKGQTKAQVVRDYNALKAAIADLLDVQTNTDDDEAIKPAMRRLNKVYDDFAKKYGRLNSNTSLSFIRKNDVQWASTAAIEKVKETVDKSGKKQITVSKTDLFTKRVVGVQAEPHPENTRDGIILSVQQFGDIRPEKIAEWLNKSKEDVEREIIESRLGFRDPETGNMLVAHEYLSGNVREKLEYAQSHNENGEYNTNIEELQKVIPMDIPAHLIEFNVGSTWIPMQLYQDYLKEKFGVTDLTIAHIGSAWIVKDSYNPSLNNEQNRQEGVYSELCRKQIYGHELLISAMNNVPVVVQRTEKKYDGTQETITDKVASAACNDKIGQIKDDFVEWARSKMQQDPELGERIQKIYNDRFNAIVPMLHINEAFLSEHLPGQNHKYSLYPHQQQAIVRGTMQPIMLAHEVGTGKTISLISIAMEMRRLGTAKKPMIVVQNATTKQFVNDAKDLYPNAKILTVEEADMTSAGRKEFYAKIKYNDWDLIIIPQSVFEKIPDNESRVYDFIQEKIDEKMHAIEAARDAGLDERTIKRMEDELESLEVDLQNGEMNGNGKKKDAKKEAEKRASAKARAEEMADRSLDDTEDFDSMGIDALLVDEAHYYKHLGFATMMARGIKGIDPTYAKKSVALYLKLQSIFERKGHRNVVFATGTPISNTAAEIWTFMKYLLPKRVLEENDIYYFDDFVHNFGKIAEQLEFGTNGKFKPNLRFAQYGNVPELMRLWLTCADCVLTREAGAVNDKVPDLEGGKAQDIFLPQSPSLIDIMAAVRAELDRFENMTGKQKKENSHIPLTMYGIAKRAAIDPRLVEADAADEPLSKTNKAVEEVLRSLKETKKYNGTVAIFCDNYQNKMSGFNLFEDIKAKLVKAGVPANQIAIIRQGMSATAKQKIFDAVREGDIRVIMGSTYTLGTGVNIQTRLHTLIHMDAPDRPMDYTQRNGRIIRQGNMHREWNLPVRVLRFGVEDSLDVTSYQRLKTKAGFIDSIMNGKTLVDNNLENRVIEDVEEGLFDNPVAVLSGSQYALLKSQAERDLRKWSARLQQHNIEQTVMADKLRRNGSDIKWQQKRIEENTRLAERLAELFPNGTVSEYNIDGTTTDNMEGVRTAIKDINKAIQDRADDMRRNGAEGEVASMNYIFSFNGIPFQVEVKLIRESRWKDGQRIISTKKSVWYGSENLGMSMTISETLDLYKLIENIISQDLSGKDARETIQVAENAIARMTKENELIADRIGKPFEYTAELEAAQAKVDDYTEKMKAEMEEKEAKYAGMASSKQVELVEQEDDETGETEEAEAQIYDMPQYADMTKAQELATSALIEALNDNTDLDVFLATDEQMPEDGSEKDVRNNKYSQVATDAWNKYQYDGELESIRDVAEYIEENMPKDETTTPLFDAIDKYRVEEEEDRMLYGERGDLEPFADAILAEIEKLMQPTREAMQTPDGTLYGWAVGDRIYLTKDGLNPNTPIHEYTHLWAKAMRRNNREGWQSIVNIFKDTPMWEEVKNDQNYAGLTTDDAVCSEVLARYSGTRGAVRMEEAAAEMLDEAQQSGSVLGMAKARQLISRVRKALSDFWHWVGTNLFGIKHFDSAEQVADRVLFDMLNQTNLGDLSGENAEAMISGWSPEKQKYISDWHDAHPRPQYQVGESLDHYRERLDAWDAEYKKFSEQLKSWQPSTAAQQPSVARSNGHEQRDNESFSSAKPAFVEGVRPTPMPDETPGEYALRLRQYYQLMRDERMVAEYIAEINAQADAAAKVLKKNTLVRGLFDAAKPIENFQEWMKERGAVITNESNAYTDTFLASGRVTQANEQMERDIIRPLAKQIGKIIAPDKETGKSRLDGLGVVWSNMDVAGTGTRLDGKELTPREIIGVYCQAKDCQEAIDLGLPDRGAAGFVNNLGRSHEDIINMVESVIPKDELDELWRLINAATHFALTYDYESGRISEDTYTQFYQREFYVPQRGWRERDESGLVSEYEPVGKRGNDPYNAALVKARGRKTLASDPFAYIMSIDASSIISSENNKIKQKFLQFCLDNENLGLKTGAFRVKKYWIMNVIDEQTGKVKLDEEGNPMMVVSYVAPSAEDMEHDRTVKDLIKQKRKELTKVSRAFAERQAHGELGPQLEAAYKSKMAQIEKTIDDLEQQMRIAWHATNSNITQRTSDEKKQHEVRVLLDGQEYVIELQDEKLANAINKKFKQHQEELFNTTGRMRNATRFMSAMLTQYNPEFAASNFARDYQVALATLIAEHPELVKPFIKNFAACQPAVWRYAFNDKVRDREAFDNTELGRYLKEYFTAGAATGFSYMQDLKSLRRDFDALINESDFRRGMKGAVGVFAMLTEVSETAVRFAGYVSAREAGMGVNDAAYLSKELTTNFDRAGEIADSGWMSWFSFFRATLNGNIKFLKALKKMPLAYSLIAASYFAMGLANQLLNPDDPEDDIWASDYTRQSNFVIWKFRIPTAHFLRMFFAAGVNAAKWMQGNKSFGEATYNTATFATQELLPNYLNVLGNGTEWNSREGRVDFTWEGLLQGVMPSPVSPIADVYFNRDFRGATINREPFVKSQEGTKDILLAKEHTLPVYKWLTQAVYEGVGGNMKTKYQSDDPAWRSWLFDTSASSVEHVVEGYMPAGMDMFITAAEAIYDASTGTPTGPDKWPFIRKFYNAYTPERAYTQQYYLLNGRIKDFERNMKDYQKNDPARYRMLRNSPEYRTYINTKKLVANEKEQPTTADVNALIEANKQWLRK